MLSGRIVARAPPSAEGAALAQRITLATGLPNERQKLVALPDCWLLVVMPPQDAGPIAACFAWDGTDNPVVGIWVSTAGACVVDRAQELCGRLRYREPALGTDGARGLLHALLAPEAVCEGRLWWRAALHRCPHEESSYSRSSWWHDEATCVGVLFLATDASGRALELREDSLEAQGIRCERSPQDY